MREASSFHGAAMATIFTQIEKAYSCYVPSKVPSVRGLLSVVSVPSLTDRGKLQTFSDTRPDGPNESSRMEDHCKYLQFQDSEKEK
jgi:hypothetical protein